MFNLTDCWPTLNFSTPIQNSKYVQFVFDEMEKRIFGILYVLVEDEVSILVEQALLETLGLKEAALTTLVMGISGSTDGDVWFEIFGVEEIGFEEWGVEIFVEVSFGGSGSWTF